MERGEIWWAQLGQPTGAAPGYSRPILIIQANRFNLSRINTIIAVALTTNLRLADAPGNVFVSTRDTGLPRDSVLNVSQIVTLDRTQITEYVGALRPERMRQVEAGLRLVLDL